MKNANRTAGIIIMAATAIAILFIISVSLLVYLLSNVIKQKTSKSMKTVRNAMSIMFSPVMYIMFLLVVLEL